MNNSKFTYITRLMTTYNLEIDIEELPDNLKCAKCKLVLKDACQTPCGCRFCRACIDDLMASGSEFCPGVAEDCGESLLSDFVTDFRANKSVSKLAVKCPQKGCLHQCQLAQLEEHMRVCGRKSVACPFHELGCQQDKLVAEEMSKHFQQENRGHCEILIGMITDINREMESHKREIEMLKKCDESRKMENEILKHELMLKDGQIKSITGQMEHLENENKSIKDEIKLIKDEKTDLTDLVRVLSVKIDREIDERQEIDKRDMANVDRKLNSISAVIGSNKNEMNTAMRSVENDIRSIKQDSMKSIQDNIICIKSQIQSIQALVGQIDVSFEWMIDEDVTKISWNEGGRLSDYFIGAVHPYKYRLASCNIHGNALWIYLRIYSGASDAQLPWPFSGRVVITVMDRKKCEVRQNITLQCEINKLPNNQYMTSYPNCAKFSHSALIQAGLNLASGVRVSCLIAPSCENQ